MNVLLSFLCCLLCCANFAQQPDRIIRTVIDGYEAEIHITDGDTMVIFNLQPSNTFPLQLYDNPEDQERYLKYRRYAAKVYPYAVHSVRLYNQIQEATNGLSKKEKKKFIQQIDQPLEQQFEDPLKNLTRTQGLILTKMIERELNQPFHSIIKELKGSFAAFYWNQLGKFNGYKLKRQYKPGEDEIMDTVLLEFDLKKDLD